MKLILGNMNYSSWSIRAALVAKMSDIDIPVEILPLSTDSTREYLLEHTGYKQVPVLLTGGMAIRDSLAITEWIAEKSGPGIVWPTDSNARARARMVVAEMHSGFTALRKQCPVDIRSREKLQNIDEALETDIARVLAVWAECRRYRQVEGPYLLGAWSAADAFYAPVVTRFRTYGIGLDGEDAAYAEAVLKHSDMTDIEAAALAEPWTMVQGPNGMENVDPS